MFGQDVFCFFFFVFFCSVIKLITSVDLQNICEFIGKGRF